MDNLCSKRMHNSDSIMSRIFNPYRGFSFEELELAYEYFTWCEDTEGVNLVAEAFCEQAKLDINL